jgi:hypothetical protein
MNPHQLNDGFIKIPNEKEKMVYTMHSFGENSNHFAFIPQL